MPYQTLPLCEGAVMRDYIIIIVVRKNGQLSQSVASVSLVIVIAQGQEFMAVNEPSPRAKPKDKVCLHCHKSLAIRAITVIYPT